MLKVMVEYSSENRRDVIEIGFTDEELETAHHDCIMSEIEEMMREIIPSWEENTGEEEHPQ